MAQLSAATYFHANRCTRLPTNLLLSCRSVQRLSSSAAAGDHSCARCGIRELRPCLFPVKGGPRKKKENYSLFWKRPVTAAFTWSAKLAFLFPPPAPRGKNTTAFPSLSFSEMPACVCFKPPNLEELKCIR